MSGPIVRRYGFPNFEQIFGKRDLEHGVEETKGQQAESEKKEEAKSTADSKPEAKTS